MTYTEIRERAENGDILLVEGSGFVSKFIRVFTGQSISHVALLVWLADGLFIAEMIEGVGYQLKPASERITGYKGIVYFGKAPIVVNDQPDCITERVLSYRADKSKQGYGYLSLLKVWWAQLWHKQYQVEKKVCSTFVQEVWTGCGYHFQQLADPGDFLGLCRYIAKVI